MRLSIPAAVLLISTSNRFRSMMQVPEQASDASSHASATPDSLRERYRPLLVFGPTNEAPRFLNQAQRLANGYSDLHERQVLFVPLSVKKGEETKAGSNGGYKGELSEEDAAAARRRFHVVPAEFVVLLIGKDGGEKYRSHTPVTIERLNGVIDAMPMRQQEVRNGNSK